MGNIAWIKIVAILSCNVPTNMNERTKEQNILGGVINKTLTDFMTIYGWEQSLLDGILLTTTHICNSILPQNKRAINLIAFK